MATAAGVETRWGRRGCCRCCFGRRASCSRAHRRLRTAFRPLGARFLDDLANQPRSVHTRIRSASQRLGFCVRVCTECGRRRNRHRRPGCWTDHESCMRPKQRVGPAVDAWRSRRCCYRWDAVPYGLGPLADTAPTAEPFTPFGTDFPLGRFTPGNADRSLSIGLLPLAPLSPLRSICSR